mmetsp:Transcript_85583/g.215684  ORF Transcript_85583/g.215684 Transcript_85583/m.215684 type:complete len:140 (+) Transcript_85583:68-487(+)
MTPEDVGDVAPSMDDRGEDSGVSSDSSRALSSESFWKDLLVCLVAVQLTVIVLQLMSAPEMSTAEMEVVKRAATHQAQHGGDIGYTMPAIWQDLESLVSCMLGAIIACGVKQMRSDGRDSASGVTSFAIKAKSLYSCLI